MAKGNLERELGSRKDKRYASILERVTGALRDNEDATSFHKSLDGSGQEQGGDLRLVV